MRLLLSKYAWHKQDDIYVTGFIRLGARYLKDAELAGYFQSAATPSQFADLLLSASGQFAVVLLRGDEAWIATDRLRSIPLFYYSEEFMAISDSAYTLFNEIPSPEINEEAVSAFVSMGYTLNNHTLVKGIYHVEAGGMVVMGNQITNIFYHNYNIAKIRYQTFNILSAELTSLLEDIFKSHFLALKDKFIAIPLSGGYDSRFIALMCKKYHPENIICFTYGRQGNPEVALAKKVSEKLQLPWLNIIYNNELIKGFVDDEVFKKYYVYTSEFTSMFFLQEYFAAKYLKDNNIVPEDAVFFSGFSGDFIAGGHLLPFMRQKRLSEFIAKEILYRNADMITLSRKEKEALSEAISKKLSFTDGETWTNFENWDIKERQSKFIVNSASVYPFFGFEYVIPFWDSKLIDYFNNIPFEFKLNKRLYDHSLTNDFFEKAGLNFLDEINPTFFKRRVQQLKQKVKLILPGFIVNLLIDKKSPVLYDEISELLLKDGGRKNFKVPPESNNYNSYLTQWYMIKVRESVTKNQYREK